MKRSRPIQRGSIGSKRRWRVQRTKAMSAVPMGMPGWPLFACWTASAASMRRGFTAFSTRSRLAVGNGGSRGRAARGGGASGKGGGGGGAGGEGGGGAGPGGGRQGGARGAPGAGGRGGPRDGRPP